MTGPLLTRRTARDALSALTLLPVFVLTACLRLGYEEMPSADADGGYSNQPDAALMLDAATAPDATTAGEGAASMDASSGSMMMDSEAEPDAASSLDASTALDAGGSVDAGIVDDAGSGSDASTPALDAGASVDAAVSCSTVITRDYCVQLPALAQAPLLDGALDCGPGLVALTPAGWTSSKAYPGDHPARYAAAWRPDGLYFYVEVDDPLLLPALAQHVDPWCGDGIELYADADGVYPSAPDYDDPGAIQLLATAPARDSSTALAVAARYHTRSLERAGDWAASRHVVVTRERGYALEAFVTAADLELNSWSLTPGVKVGLDIAINVSVASETEQVDCGYSLGQYYLRVSRTPCSNDACRPYSNAAAFCSPTLEGVSAAPP